MTAMNHPLKGEFDLEQARWSEIPNARGEVGLLIGFADNGLVALREPGEEDQTVMIYTPSEWAAFVEGVKDGEFNLDSLKRQLAL